MRNFPIASSARGRLALAVVVCTASLFAVITSFAAAGAARPSGLVVRHSGDSSVYRVDVGATPGHGFGTLMVNLDRHRFVFHGKGFEPNKEYLLQRDSRVLAAAVATRSGNLHAMGAWSGAASTLTTVTVVRSSYFAPRTGTLTRTDTDPNLGTYYVFQDDVDAGYAWVIYSVTPSISPDLVGQKGAATLSVASLSAPAGPCSSYISAGILETIDDVSHSVAVLQRSGETCTLPTP